VPAVVLPIAPGAANVLPLRVDALIVPLPVKLRLAPLPTTIAAVVLVPLVIPENGTVPAESPEAATQLGAVPVPLLCRTYPLVPGLTAAIAPVPLPYNTPYCVKLLAPVPP